MIWFMSGPKDFLVSEDSALSQKVFLTSGWLHSEHSSLSVHVFSRLQSSESLEELFKMSEGMSSGVFFMSADKIIEKRRLNQSESRK